tara:strand:+ start:162 stop:731 length:570 start_codon:yes stop_codon:yes gene_type:complete
MKNEFLNFDGAWDEESPMIDFSGDVENIELDSEDEFDYFIRSKSTRTCIKNYQAQGKSKNEAVLLCRTERRGDDVGSSASAPTDKKGCVQYYRDMGMSKRTANAKCKLSTKYGTSSGGTLSSGASSGGASSGGDEIEGGEQIIDANGMPVANTPINKAVAGLGGKKGLMIAGGVLVAGIIGYLAIKRGK